MNKWAACRDELIKISAPEKSNYLLREIEGVCPIHGLPMVYRDLEQQEAYCPMDEGVKEKRAGIKYIMTKSPLKKLMKNISMKRVMKQSDFKTVMKGR